MLYGVVSDTHGYLPPQLRTLFAGVDRILHAGDIGSQSVIDELARIAPVLAVHGNVDSGKLAADYPSRLDFQADGHTVLLLHRAGQAVGADPALSALIRQLRPDIIVYGHSHRAVAEWADGIYLFNPGLGGRPRFGIKPSVGLLTVEPGRIEGRIMPLE